MSKLKEENSTSRRKHTNSKLGCANCKRKKIRCDENLPQCFNCSKGKKEVCSYLSLNQSQLNRIRLTHSLRNSQNKLLNHDYRLPATSSVSIVPPSNNQNISPSDSIEFNHELTRLPIITPIVKYSSLQFDNLTVDDFTKTDQKSSFNFHQNTPIPPHQSNHSMLPNGLLRPILISKLDYTLTHYNINTTTTNPDFLRQLNREKWSCLNLSNQISIKLIVVDLVFDTLKLIGLNIIENNLKINQKSRQLNNFSSSNLSLINISSKILHDQIFDRLTIAANKSQVDWIDLSLDVIEQKLQALGYVYHLLNFYLDLQFENHCLLSNMFSEMFEVYVVKATKELQNYGYQNQFSFSILLQYIQYTLVGSRIPSYQPDFFHEIISNLNDLNYLYNNQTRLFQENSLSKYLNIKYEYNSLIEFLNQDLLPMIFKERNENYVSTYKETTIFKLVEKWHKIFPTTAITYSPNQDLESFQMRLVQDLSTTLYIYYISISAALDAVFPICQYLFTISFVTRTSNFYQNKQIMTPLKQNQLYEEILPISPWKIYQSLQNHNYYSMRMYAFFRRRYLIYQRYITWNEAYNDEVKLNRTQSRLVSNSVEVPVKSFNTTLIRPEHYPTMKLANNDSNCGTYLTRIDENLERKLYTRNIEKLNFFNEISLQYDYETMLLLRDYRILEEDLDPHVIKVDIHDMLDYYRDRAKIVSNVKN